MIYVANVRIKQNVYLEVLDGGKESFNLFIVHDKLTFFDRL